MERDSETSHDHTTFRQYASNFERWMSPDPRAGDITNPQSWNRYAYVANNPSTLIDPKGLDVVPCGHGAARYQPCTPMQANGWNLWGPQFYSIDGAGRSTVA